MNRRKINLPYLFLGAAYLLYYFTHLPIIYVFLGITYIYMALKGH